MSVRAKFKLVESTEQYWDGGRGRRIKFATQYDPSIPEDQRFTKATPTGELTMVVDNPAALEQLKLGQDYYLDFTPVPPPEPKS